MSTASTMLGWRAKWACKSPRYGSSTVQYKKYCFCRIFSWPRCSPHVARYGWESVCRPWFFKCSVSQVWGEIIFTTIDSNVAIWSATDLLLSLRAQTKFLVSTCHTMVTHWKDCFIWRWWFSVVCTLVGNDYRHHSGQNVADSRGAATTDFLLLFHPRNIKGNVLALSFWVYWHLLQHKASHVFEEANQKANK